MLNFVLFWLSIVLISFVQTELLISYKSEHNDDGTKWLFKVNEDNNMFRNMKSTDITQSCTTAPMIKSLFIPNILIQQVLTFLSWFKISLLIFWSGYSSSYPDLQEKLLESILNCYCGFLLPFISSLENENLNQIDPFKDVLAPLEGNQGKMGKTKRWNAKAIFLFDSTVSIIAETYIYKV